MPNMAKIATKHNVSIFFKRLCPIDYQIDIYICILLFYSPQNILQMKNVMYANKQLVYVCRWGRSTLSTVVRWFSPWGEQLIVPCDIKG